MRDESVAWNRRLTELLAPIEGEAPRHRHGHWRVALDSGAWFVGPRELTVPFTWPVTRSGFLDRIRWISFVAAAPLVLKEKLLDPFAYRSEAIVLDRR